jgi:hypothetical protein
LLNGLSLSSERRYQLKKTYKKYNIEIPSKKMNTKKDTILRIRISNQDKDAIRKTAEQEQKTISAYVRDASLKKQAR